MYECSTTVIGTVITPVAPRTVNSRGDRVAGFTVVSTSRVYDRASSEWRDGTKLFVRVNCWNRSATNVAGAVAKGDPVIVHGDLYSSTYTDKDGVERSALEMRARAIGVDLARHAPAATADVDAPDAGVAVEDSDETSFLATDVPTGHEQANTAGDDSPELDGASEPVAA
ncbi:single-stranded DNA-binding protein [Hoyosella sp. G463]|uniref:Single-stranded DNA-binding protein n=1 Tax=Lolliginicoccus lacisalsi TaxID=2742202 RepID=A0A927JAP2_9ACTN|nr:single-stranded DNA-binding protein [Lolliginicoccus lacisalsi]MBD8505709.1 single-stranded DNA-binding protein [Lolliginicoccus lacisalsi]